MNCDTGTKERNSGNIKFVKEVQYLSYVERIQVQIDPVLVKVFFNSHNRTFSS
jgi:hypothetical protein